MGEALRAPASPSARARHRGRLCARPLRLPPAPRSGGGFARARAKKIAQTRAFFVDKRGKSVYDNSISKNPSAHERRQVARGTRIPQRAARFAASAALPARYETAPSGKSLRGFANRAQRAAARPASAAIKVEPRSHASLNDVFEGAFIFQKIILYARRRL